MRTSILLLVGTLLIAQQDTGGQKQPIAPITASDTISIITTSDSLIIKLIEKIDKNNKEIIQASIPLKKADKQLTTSLKKLQKYVAKKEGDVVKSKSIAPVSPAKNKSLWQKFKSIFKRKKSKL